jgi:rRNA maturation protein Nop10
MILKKCTNSECGAYNLTFKCRKCGSQTKEAHYKFLKIKDAPKISDPRKIRKR